MIKLANPIASAAVPNVVIRKVRSASGLAVSSDEENWTTRELIETDKGKRVDLKRQIWALQDLCRVKKCTVPTSVSEAVSLVIEPMSSTAVSS